MGAQQRGRNGRWDRRRLGAVVVAVVVVTAVVALVALPGSAAGSADGSAFRAHLGGYQETPAISTTGHGAFRAELTHGGAPLRYELTYADLVAPAQVAHIHFGQRGVAGGVSAFLCGGGGKPACPAGTTATATVTGTIVAADVVGPAGQGLAAGEFAALLRAMRAGVTYALVLPFFSAARAVSPRRFAASSTAPASGCSERRSAAAA